MLKEYNDRNGTNKKRGAVSNETVLSFDSKMKYILESWCLFSCLQKGELSNFR
jgi:hypothetical protein